MFSVTISGTLLGLLWREEDMMRRDHLIEEKVSA